MLFAYRFLLAGVCFALVGMSLGIYMGSTHDFVLAPAHAHINLVGWVSHFLYGLYYRGEPTLTKRRLPHVHFYTALAGGIILPLGIGTLLLGGPEIIAIVGAILTMAGMIMFATVVVEGLRANR